MAAARIALYSLVVALVALFALADPGPVSALVEPQLICIDPGHGGSEPGAVNGTLLEKDINLDIALELEKRFTDDDHQVVLTRTDDSTLSIRERYTICNAAGADLLLSVHTNSLADPDRDGIITIYFHNDDRVLAQALHDVLRPAMAAGLEHTFQDFGVKRDALGMVLKSNMPAAVIEPVMMSHPDEARWLADSIASCDPGAIEHCRRAEIADAIYVGTSAYIEAMSSGGGGGGGGGGPGDFCVRNPDHRRCS